MAERKYLARLGFVSFHLENEDVLCKIELARLQLADRREISGIPQTITIRYSIQAFDQLNIFDIFNRAIFHIVGQLGMRVVDIHLTIQDEQLYILLDLVGLPNGAGQ
jgi:hypothetical protein